MAVFSCFVKKVMIRGYMASEPAPRSRAEDKFITPKEAAGVLKVSIFTFYDWMKNPKRMPGLPVRRFGKRCIRIPRKEFFLWLEGK